MLFVTHKIKMSLRSLKRILRDMGLKRKNIIETPLELVAAAIYAEVHSSGLNIGYRAMWQHLRSEYKFSVKCKTVLQLMNIVDPAGIENRSRHRLKRRLYDVPRPNHLWHVDGFDKLKEYGMAISGCVDGFSCKVIWCQVATTNNKPQVIAYYYLCAIKEHNSLPAIVRSDRGTENTLIESMQKILRHDHEDAAAKEYSFLKGKSTANERIEKYWKQLLNSTLDFYRQLFKPMKNDGILDTSDPLHIEVLRYCFAPIVDQELKRSVTEWNQHRIRQQKNIRSPCGIPNIMYHWPQKYKAKDCKKTVNMEEVDFLLRTRTISPQIYYDGSDKLIKKLMPDITIPETTNEAYDTFIKIIESVREIEVLAE